MLSESRIEQERVRFEKYYLGNPPLGKLDRNLSGGYVYMQAALDFNVWLAAIEAQEITLPEPSAYIKLNDYGKEIVAAKSHLDNLSSDWQWLRSRWADATPLFKMVTK